MGLDFVELVLEVEDEFGIYLPDRDMELITTPDSLATYIFDKYKNIDDNRCSSQVAFYKLRKLFMQNFGNSRKDIKPNSSLKELLGDDIKYKWIKLKALLDNDNYPSDLFLSKKENLQLLYFIVAMSWILYYFIGNLLATSLIAIISYGLLWMALSEIYGESIPKKYEKFSSLIKYMDNYIPSNYNTKEKVLKKVIEISSEQLNIPIDEIKPYSRYVEDLGVD